MAFDDWWCRRAGGGLGGSGGWKGREGPGSPTQSLGDEVDKGDREGSSSHRVALDVAQLRGKRKENQ